MNRLGIVVGHLAHEFEVIKRSEERRWLVVPQHASIEFCLEVLITGVTDSFKGPYEVLTVEGGSAAIVEENDCSTAVSQGREDSNGEQVGRRPDRSIRTDESSGRVKLQD